MLDEEVIIKTARNGNERLLFANVLVIVGLTAFMMGGNSELSAGIFLGLGIVAPINVFVYKRTWLDADPRVLQKYLLALLPFIVSLGVAIAGLFNPVVVQHITGGREYFKIIESQSALVSGSISVAQPILTELDTIACVACALSIYFITDSRYTIRRTLFFCCVIAAVLAFFGIFYKSLSMMNTFEYLPSLGPNSFSTFTNSEHWAAFAIIWLGTSLGLSIYTAQRFRIDYFVRSLRFALIVCASLLFASIMCSGTPAEEVIAMFIAACACSILAVDTIPTKNNFKRHWVGRPSKMPQHRFLGGIIPCLCYTLAAVSLVASGIMLTIFSLGNDAEKLLVDSKNSDTITLAEKAAVYDDAQNMLRERPVFGWGTASFRSVFAFEQGSDLGVESWISPSSDLLQKLSENGIAGLALSALTPFAFFVMWLVRRSFSTSGAIFILTCASMLALGVIESPFRCLSVELGFWIVLMSAFRWDNAVVK